LLLISWPILPWFSLGPCPHQKACRQPWPWHRERKKLHDYEKKLAKKEVIQKILTAKLEKYTGFQNLCTSHMNFLYRQLTPPFLLTTPRIFGKPLEFPAANIKHIASWSEVDSQGGSSLRQKEKRVVEKSSSSFCAIVVQRW